MADIPAYIFFINQTSASQTTSVFSDGFKIAIQSHRYLIQSYLIIVGDQNKYLNAAMVCHTL